MSHTIRNKAHSKAYHKWMSAKSKFHMLVNEQVYDRYRVKTMCFDPIEDGCMEKFDRRVNVVRQAIHYRRERLKVMALKCKELKKKVKQLNYDPD